MEALIKKCQGCGEVKQVKPLGLHKEEICAECTFELDDILSSCAQANIPVPTSRTTEVYQVM